jgi:hypothetical protein
MSGDLAVFPAWKKTATAAERFSELEGTARIHPERFTKVAVIYQEVLPGNKTTIRQISVGCNTDELLGILEQGKLQVLKDTGGL